LKFKIDEDLRAECASILREAGFDAATAAEEKLSGADDSILSARCRAESRILVTLDLDFANVQAYPPKSHSGVVVFRPNAQDKPTLIALLKRLLPVLKQRSPNQQLWIVEQDRIRYREE
jgi:predicted nuclease of predicted toxin-antitoxin system